MGKILRAAPWIGLAIAVVLIPLDGALLAEGTLRPSSTNSRYFCDASGKIVYLAGLHDGWELQDFAWDDADERVELDWPTFLDDLARHRLNVIRLWCVEATKIADDDPELTTPMPYLRAGDGPAANDGLGRFDLDRFNPAYFDRLRTRVADANARGIYVIVMLFQGWSIEDKGGKVNPWPYHPFHRDNNTNGVDADLNRDGQGKELHTWLGPDHAITSRQRAYVKKVVDTVGPFDNVLFEIANESHGESIAWQSRMVDFIHRYESTRPKQHPVGITVPFARPWKHGLNRELLKTPADWISPNREAPEGYSFRFHPPLADGRKVILSDTDHFFGVGCKDYRWVWRTFLRGHNPLYMDRWSQEQDDPARRQVRRALGVTGAVAERIDLAVMRPEPKLASSGYCLAVRGKQYLVYLDASDAIAVDLSDARSTFTAEWIDPCTGATTSGANVSGGGTRTLKPSLAGDAVLLLEEAVAAD